MVKDGEIVYTGAELPPTGDLLARKGKVLSLVLFIGDDVYKLCFIDFVECAIETGVSENNSWEFCFALLEVMST